jgi:hypothetical protein
MPATLTPSTGVPLSAVAPLPSVSPLSTVDFRILPRAAAAVEPVEQTLLTRKPMSRVVLSPIGLYMVLLGLFSFGVVFAMFAYLYSGVAPRRVTLKGRRLYSDKLPAGGVSIDDAIVEPKTMKFLGLTLNKFVNIHYRNDRGKFCILAISRQMYPRTQFDNVLPTLAALYG